VIIRQKYSGRHYSSNFSIDSQNHSAGETQISIRRISEASRKITIVVAQLYRYPQDFVTRRLMQMKTEVGLMTVMKSSSVPSGNGASTNPPAAFVTGVKRLVPNLEGRGEHTRSLYELAVRLNSEQTLASIGETLGRYCAQAFRSPAGMIFTEENGDLRVASRWRVKSIPKDGLAEDAIKKGPAARAFRSGKPVFCRLNRPPRSATLRVWFRLLRRAQRAGMTFLPITGPAQRPLGVLVLVLPDVREFLSAQDKLLRFTEIVSGCIVRARAYEEALATRLIAENANRSTEEFLSTLSHELRNPMMPILGWATALSTGTLPAEKQNLALEGIIRNVRALNYLIEDLFDAARISSGKLRLEPTPMRIQDAAREALAAVQQAASAKRLRISTDISEAIPQFTADSRRLQQVLVNLLNNAVKFTPAGGAIGLEVRRRGGSVECIVSDTGKGIEPKLLPFVFERYRQGVTGAKVHSPGLGLGLAIVREIVELHNGSITAVSAGADRGSTFTLRLPMRRKPARRAKPSTATRFREISRTTPEKTLPDVRFNSDSRRSSGM
jgi:signal transduction histidine kinase